MSYSNSEKIRIPAQNSADNSYIQDVIGNKTDDENGDSLKSLAYIQDRHIHSKGLVYPDLANDVQITSGATGAWSVGTIVEIVPANTITDIFDLHFFSLSAISGTGKFQICFYSGAEGAEELIACKKFAKGTNNEPLISQPLQTQLIPANTRISASLACAAGTAKTVDVSIAYHKY